MRDKEDTPTPVLEEPPVSSTDKHDPKTITDRFTVIDKIGSGGMGRVYKVLDSRLDKMVAIKVLLQDSFTNEQWLRFQREAKTTSKLNHPSIVKVLDFGQTDSNQPFLIMEYIQGTSLDVYLKENGPFTAEDALHIISMLCNALSHAHSKQIIHRDLKPSNIIVAKEEEEEDLKFMLLDFGIAKITEDVKGVSTLTKTGQIVGSPRCISPEQALGENVDERADIYSLGCIAYEILTGNAVFEGDSALEVIDKHINEKAPELSIEDSSIGDELGKFIGKALEKSPEDRYQTMMEFESVCKSLLESITEEPEESTLEEKKRETKGPKNFKIIILMVALSLIGLSFILSQTNQSQEVVKSSKSANLETSDNFQAESMNSIERTIFSFDKTTITASKNNIESKLKKQLKKKPAANKLMLVGCKIDNKALQAVDKLKSLNKLTIERCQSSSSELAEYISSRKVKTLKLLLTPISMEIAKAIGANQSISVLSLRGSSLNDNLLGEIGKNKNLRSINIAQNKDVSLDGLKKLKPEQPLLIIYNKENEKLPESLLKVIELENITFTKMSEL